jgi:putative ABC transport system substrate-binding protein
MRRRAFIVGLAGAATMPLRARVQERVRRIGALMGMAENDPQARLNARAFWQGLRGRGWIEERNIRIDVRHGLGSAAPINRATAELLALAPEVILAQGTAITAELQRQTRSIPVVFTVVSDPLGSGFVQSFARPGGNITGFTNFLEPSIGAKWVELLREIAPGVTRAAILFNPKMAAGHGGLYFAQPAETAAAAHGMKAMLTPVQNPTDIERSIEALARDSGGGLIVPPDATTNNNRELITTLAVRNRLPGVYPYRHFLPSGGLMSYGINYADVFARAAEYVDRILRGEKPADLPVQAPTKYELVINLKAAKALSLTVPPALLARADEVIE